MSGGRRVSDWGSRRRPHFDLAITPDIRPIFVPFGASGRAVVRSGLRNGGADEPRNGLRNGAPSRLPGSGAGGGVRAVHTLWASRDAGVGPGLQHAVGFVTTRAVAGPAAASKGMHRRQATNQALTCTVTGSLASDHCRAACRGDDRRTESREKHKARPVPDDSSVTHQPAPGTRAVMVSSGPSARW